MAAGQGTKLTKSFPANFPLYFFLLSHSCFMKVSFYIKNIVLHPRSFFLENIGVRQTILKNTFWLSFSELVSRALKLVLIIFIARMLGATEYGKFTFALAFVSLFAVISDFGISSITTRELAKDREKEKEYFSLLSLKIFLSLITLFLIFLLSFFITSSRQIQQVIWILGAYIVISVFCNIWYAFFRARQQMEYEAWGKILQAIAVTLGGMAVLFLIPSIKAISFAYAGGAVVALMFILVFFRLKAYPLKLGFNTNIWKRYLSLSWPLALGALFVTLYNNIDSTMMGYFGQIAQTGWYNAAYKIVAASLIPLGLLNQVFYPVLSNYFANHSKADLQKVWNRYIKSSFFLAVPIVVGGAVLAPRIIDFIYSKAAYGPSVLAFQLLIIMAGLLYLSSPLSQILVIFNQQSKTFWISLTGAVVNVILNFILIPKYSLYGAAITTIVTCVIILVMFFLAAKKFTFVNPFPESVFPNFIGVLLSSIVMYSVLVFPFVIHRNVLISIAIGAIVYFAAYFLYWEFIRLFRGK